MNRYIGIDLGTSSVKLVLMRADGTVEKSISGAYEVSYPHSGWSEQKPEDWIDAVNEAVPELIRDIPHASVKGIGVAGQMHGLVSLDKDENVIRPCILWNDGRTQKQTDYLNDVIGREKLAEYTANIAFAGFTAPKLLWVWENEPDNFAKIDKIMLPKDYLNYYMTGVHCTDYSDASGMLLLDVKNKCWSKEMADICHVTEKMLPKLYESHEVVGTLLPEIAEKWGLSDGVKVVAGAGDNAAAAIGTGTCGDGMCNISLGTSGTIFLSSDRFFNVSNYGLHSFAHADGGYHLMGCMLSAASCNSWFCDEVLGTSDYAGEQALITDDKLGRNDVYFLPYLMGERSPINDTFARGTFIGMRPDTKRTELYQAVLEGVCFAMRDSLELARGLGLNVEESCLCGGGGKSPLWRKIMANVLNVRIRIPKFEEGPGYGGAMLASVGCGEYASVAECAGALTGAKSYVEPDADISGRYEERYNKFRMIYPALKDVFAKLI